MSLFQQQAFHQNNQPWQTTNPLLSASKLPSAIGLHNKAYKSAVKTLMKKYFVAVEKYAANPSPEAKEEAQNHMASAQSKIDKAVKRGVIHPNNAARKKSRLAKALKRHETVASEAS